jgi:hypothetical protein
MPIDRGADDAGSMGIWIKVKQAGTAHRVGQVTVCTSGAPTSRPRPEGQQGRQRPRGGSGLSADAAGPRAPGGRLARIVMGLPDIPALLANPFRRTGVIVGTAPERAGDLQELAALGPSAR